MRNSTFVCDDHFCDTLDRQFKNFWWDSICMPCSQRGLGIRDMKSTNLVLSLLQNWDGRFSTTLIVLGCNTFRKNTLVMEIFCHRSPTPNSASWLWKGIKKSCSLIYSPWVLVSKFPSTLHFLFGQQHGSLLCLDTHLTNPRFPHNRNLLSSLISYFILPETNKWNLQALSYVFDAPSICEITKIHISLAPQHKFLWTFSTYISRKFTTNSAYLAIQQNRSTITTLLIGTSPTFWKSLWKLN